MSGREEPIREVVASLTRVAVLPWPGEANIPREPWYLKRMGDRISSLLGKTEIGKIIGRSFGRRRTAKRLRTHPADFGVSSMEHPLLEVVEYGFGVVAVRVRMKLCPNAPLGELAERWAVLASALARPAINSTLSEVVPSRSLSRFYSVIHLVRGGRPLALIRPEILFRLTAPLSGWEPDLARAASYGPEKGAARGDYYYVAKNGAVLQFRSLSGPRRRYARRILRRFAHLAADVALAQSNFFTTPGLWNSEEELYRGGVLLSPELWKSGLLVRRRSLTAMYRRISSPLEVEKLYEGFLKLAPRLMVGFLSRIPSEVAAVAASLGIRCEFQVAPAIRKGTAGVVLDFLITAEAAWERGMDAARVADVLAAAAEVGGLRPRKDVRRKLKEKMESSGGKGLTASEVSLLAGMDYNRVRQVLNELVEEGLVKPVEKKRRGGRGNPKVVVYEVNTELETIRRAVEERKVVIARRSIGKKINPSDLVSGG